ncbi:MAG: YciI family protein [Propionibacteriales bacterium]|nr:YciI family protein [Propionibacteriales bacterium]
MQYALLIYGNEKAGADASPEENDAVMGEYLAYGEWLKGQGWQRGGEALEPTTEATTVQVRDGSTTTTDGPFAETREQLGGFYLVECDSLDEAIEAASRIPAAKSGSIEVRPVVDFSQPPQP